MQLDGDQRDLFPTGKQPEPLVCALQGDKFALGRDEQTILIDIDGNPCTKYTLTWSERPTLLGILDYNFKNCFCFLNFVSLLFSKLRIRHTSSECYHQA